MHSLVRNFVPKEDPRELPTSRVRLAAKGKSLSWGWWGNRRQNIPHEVRVDDIK